MTSTRVGSLHHASLPFQMLPVLSPFARCWAFPSSDDYDDSVPLAVAFRRESQVPSTPYGKPRVGALSSPSSGSFPDVPSHRRVCASIPSKRVGAGAASDASSVGLGLDHWRLGFKRRSFTMLACLAAPRTQRLGPEPLSWHARFPRTFQLEVSPVT